MSRRQPVPDDPEGSYRGSGRYVRVVGELRGRIRLGCATAA